MALQAGTVFVPVIPSLKGFQARIARELGGVGRESGRTFGRQFAPAAADEAEAGLERGLGGGGLNTLMTGLGVAAGAALTAALVGAVDASAVQGKLAAQLGLTTGESKRIGAIAGRLYAQAYGESMDDVRAAITSVIQNLDGMRTASSEALQETTARAMTVASVMDEEVGGVTRAVAQMLKTGLAKNAQEAFDILVAGTQRGANRAEDLLDTFTEYGTQFRKLGLDGKTAMGLIQQGLQGGARDADIVADAIKEFSIRAVDGSKTTAEGFKALGLDADRMAQQIAQGGPTASRALDMILDRIRAVKDPVKQSQIAVALFGTQAEDLGKALFTLDPSKATQSLGGLAGATDRAGKAMHETSAARLTQFKRSVETNITNVIANDVLPALDRLKGAGDAVGIGPERAVQGIFILGGLAAAYKAVAVAAVIATTSVRGFSIASVFAGGAAAAAGFVAGLRNVNLAYAANATFANRLGAAIRGQIILWRAQAAAAGVSTARIIANAAAQRIAAVATRAWAVAQAIFNAVMSANPIALVVIAIAAIVAAVVLAYNRFTWFRNLVNTVWTAVGTAIVTAWNFIRPIFTAIASVLVTVVGTALRWYWAYVKFVFTTVWTVIQFAWNLIRPIFTAIASVVRTVLGVAFVWFQNIFKIVWIAIQIYIKVAWAIIKTYFNLIKLYVQHVLAPIFRWLYNNVIKPVWSGIKWAISAAWAGIKVVWAALRAYVIGPIVNAFKVARAGISVAWNAVRSVIVSVYNSYIRPAFDRLKSALSTVRDAFRTAVAAIKSHWDKLKNVAKAPVNFVIGVYNKGIVGLVNKLADFVGVKTRLNEIPKLARGGTLNNPLAAQPMMTNGPMAIVGEGRQQYPEYVIPTDPRFRRRAQGLWAAAGNDLGAYDGPDRKWLTGRNRLGGEGIAFERGGSLQALAFGGIIGDFVKSVRDFTIGNVEGGARRLLDKVLGGSIPGSGLFRNIVAAIPGWIKDKVLGWIKAKVSIGGGPGMQRGLAWAKTQHGKGYQWGGNGNPSWDCSGFTSAIESVIRGQKPHRRWSTHPFHGGGRNPMPGWYRNQRSGYMIGVTGAGVGHVAGTLLGKAVESSGSGGVRVGGGARGATHSMFPYRYGLKLAEGGTLEYDGGGLLHKGLNLAYHGARRPDRVLSDSQWSAIYQAAQGGDGPAMVNNIYPRTLDMTVRDLDVLQRQQEARARVGRPH